MTTNQSVHSDLYGLYNIVQSNAILFPKELIVAQLKDYFSRDTQYHYVADHFGFPQTPDQTNLPQSAGYKDNLTTRVFINSSHRFDVIYYPSIIVRHGGASSVPISINRETSSVQWGNLVFEDGYGNIKLLPTPENYIFAGAWEGSINVDIAARDPRTRDDLVELVMLLFTDLAYEDLVKNGLAIKPNGGVSAAAPTEILDRADTLFKQTITLNFRSEWRRQIPVRSVIDVINTSIEFGRTDIKNYPIALNLTIHTEQNLQDVINSL